MIQRGAVAMLIIEGADCVGKTTLAKKLLRVLDNHVYAHFTRLPSGFDYYWGYVERMSVNIVQDRFHLSEIVYSRVRGVESPLTPELYRLVDAQVRLRAGYTILITADEGLVRKRWDKGQMYNIDDTLRAVSLYNDLTEVRLGFGDFSDYTPDIDAYYHCTEGNPYVPDYIIDQMVNDYYRRLHLYSSTAKQRPYRL
jgi:thymidylate kinase